MKRPQPVKGLDGGWHSDRHGHDRKGKSRVGTHATHEHVMSPHHEPEQADREHGIHHRLITKDRLARERRKYLWGNSHPGKDRDVDLGMTEEPEKVLPKQRRTTFMSGELTVNGAQRQKETGTDV